jgi:hypothetical protein
MYEQTLYKVLPDHVKPKILKRMNRYNKWEYGYNEDHDMIVISKTGQIGESIQKNLKKNITTILIMSLKDAKKVSGISTKIFLLMLLVRITCIYNGLRLM